MNKEQYFLSIKNIRKTDGSELTEEEKEKLWEKNLKLIKDYTTIKDKRWGTPYLDALLNSEEDEKK